MSKQKSRDNKSATTFWMEKDLKKNAQEKVRLIENFTLTDLINRAVKIYLEESHKEDGDMGSKIARASDKLAMAELSQNIVVTQLENKLETRISKLENTITDTVTILKDIETQVDELITGKKFQQTIRAEVALMVTPVMERLQELLEGIMRT
ncbi:MAG: hypothetical protein ACW99A_09460 [Candidatus Kariarchaeaceae archaeon]